MSYGLYQTGLRPVFDPIVADLRSFDPGLVLVFNIRNTSYEVYDRNAPGGPKWQMVMRVPSGRRFDQRSLDVLRQAKHRPVADLMREMEAKADKRDAAVERHHKNLAASFADDLKFIGRKITPSVESRNRTREAIRQEAAS